MCGQAEETKRGRQAFGGDSSVSRFTNNESSLTKQKISMEIHVHLKLQRYNGILVPVRTSFGLRRRGGKTYNISRLMWIC